MRKAFEGVGKHVTMADPEFERIYGGVMKRIWEDPELTCYRIMMGETMEREIRRRMGKMLENAKFRVNHAVKT